MRFSVMIIKIYNQFLFCLKEGVFLAWQNEYRLEKTLNK
jgi:hypothetical protein